MMPERKKDVLNTKDKDIGSLNKTGTNQDWNINTAPFCVMSDKDLNSLSLSIPICKVGMTIWYLPGIL
jgi:hypothetical protein